MTSMPTKTQINPFPLPYEQIQKKQTENESRIYADFKIPHNLLAQIVNLIGVKGLENIRYAVDGQALDAKGVFELCKSRGIALIDIASIMFGLVKSNLSPEEDGCVHISFNELVELGNRFKKPFVRTVYAFMNKKCGQEAFLPAQGDHKEAVPLDAPRPAAPSVLVNKTSYSSDNYQTEPVLRLLAKIEEIKPELVAEFINESKLLEGGGHA